MELGETKCLLGEASSYACTPFEGQDRSLVRACYDFASHAGAGHTTQSESAFSCLYSVARFPTLGRRALVAGRTTMLSTMIVCVIVLFGTILIIGMIQMLSDGL